MIGARSMADTRIERDSLGEMVVPANAYYGAQTARAVENFPISGLRFPRSFIAALGTIKGACARVNAALGLLDRRLADAIARAAAEVAEGKLDGEFVVDVFQTGSGTSTNMNANEVIANRAVELLGARRGDKSVVAAAPGRAADRRHRPRHRPERAAGLRREGRGGAGGRDRAPLRDGAEPLRGDAEPRRRGRDLGRAPHPRRRAHEDRQRPPPAHLGRAHGPERDRAARDAARLEHHAGEGEPGDPRGGEPGGGARDRPRHDHRDRGHEREPGPERDDARHRARAPRAGRRDDGGRSRLRAQMRGRHPRQRGALPPVRGADRAARDRDRARGRLRSRRRALQEGARARRADPAGPRGREGPPQGGDRAPPRPAPARARRSGTGVAMRRALALLALALGTSGCFVSLGNLGLLRGERPLQETRLEGEGRAKVLLVDVSNVITDLPTRHAFGLIEEESTVARVHAELKKAADDERVKAIVVRVNSPGGGVTASDDVYGEIVRFKKERKVPVVAALGDVAASGGYYVACAADQIVAHPTTVTGSIGVILAGLNLEGLLAKVGVRNQTFKAGEHKDLLSPLRAATPEERRIVQSILDGLHARFVSVVRESRPRLDVSWLADLTDGRIFDAQQAIQAGLIDQIGDLHAAIDAAKAAA